MKKFILLMTCLMVWVSLAWAEEKMYFVTALSAPIASFNTVETKDCVPTTISANSQMNIGSDVAGTGIIRLVPNAGPMKVESLLLADNTKLGGSANWKKWLLSNLLTVGDDSVVTVGGILANQLQLRNGAQETTVTVNQTLKVNSSLTVKDVNVYQHPGTTLREAKLQVGSCEENSEGAYNNDCFYFYCNKNGGCGPSSATAAAKALSKQTGEPSETDLTYKPIYTN